MRSVYVFRLRPVGPTHYRPQDDSPQGAPAVIPTVSVEPAEAPSGGAEVKIIDVEANNATTFTSPGSGPIEGDRAESSLSDRFRAYLEAEQHVVRRLSINPRGAMYWLKSDIFDVTNGELFEVKAASTRENVRMALGQLLDYRRGVEDIRRLSVLLPSEPAADLICLLGEHNIGCVFETSPGTFVRR